MVRKKDVIWNKTTPDFCISRSPTMCFSSTHCLTINREDRNIEAFPRQDRLLSDLLDDLLGLLQDLLENLLDKLALTLAIL
jgi:hypothetical protein